MASLTGNAINTSYSGLLKTVDNGVVGAIEKQLTDGEGNALPISAGTSGVSFTGDVDFTSANPIGLPNDLPTGGTSGQVLAKIDGTDYNAEWTTPSGGAAGLVSGTGTNTLKNADSLVTLPTSAVFSGDIALGNGACANGVSVSAVAIGNGAKALYSGVVAIGNNAKSEGGGNAVVIGDGAISDKNGVVIGKNARGQSDYEIVIGQSGYAQNRGVAIGFLSCDSLGRSVVVGTSAKGLGGCNVSLGHLSCSTANAGIAIGLSSLSNGTCSIAIGNAASAPSQRSISIGDTTTSGPAGVALGWSADSSDSGVAIGANAFSGAPTIAASVAIGQAATTTTANRAVALGSCSTVSGQCGLAIGNEATASGANAIHIAGNPAFSSHAASGTCSIVIGFAANATAAGSVALGASVTAAKTNTVSVTELETQLAGGGITMKSPNGTEYKLTVSDAGALVIT